MRICLLVAAALLAAWADTRPEPQIKENDLDRFRGTWTLDSLVRDGVDGGQDEMTWTFEGDRCRIVWPNAAHEVELRVRLDQTKKPREFDAWYEGDDDNLKQAYPSPVRGIYEFRGQKLVRCYRPPGEERPKSFESTQGSNAVLVTLKRAAVPAAK